MTQKQPAQTVANKTRLTKGLFTSTTEEWETPNYVFLSLNQEFKFQVDVCATSENAKCKIFFDKSVDGLKENGVHFDVG